MKLALRVCLNLLTSVCAIIILMLSLANTTNNTLWHRIIPVLNCWFDFLRNFEVSGRCCREDSHLLSFRQPPALHPMYPEESEWLTPLL